MEHNTVFVSQLKRLLIVSLILTGSHCFSDLFAQNSNWHAPTTADLMKPSVDINSPKIIQFGKELYTQLCAVCHGDKGKGDGIAGMALTPKPGNFTAKKFQAQSNGAVYWKITEGNPPMASYKSTLTDEQRWELVAYIRTLEKK